ADVHDFRVSAFFSNQYAGNYMPLTMLLYAVDWALFHQAPAGHHIVALLFHCVNGLLVLILSLRLFQNTWGALLCALLFCIHPLQVESVAWVAETKTVLCAFFFLFAVERYLDYTDTQNKNVLYLKAMPLFILSLLAKPAALCFPLCLICLDLIRERRITKQTLLEKIPFFAVALFMGIVTIYTQQQGKYINPNHAFGIHQKIGYAGFALLSYISKFLFPVGQSVIYPYPTNTTSAILLGYFLLVILGFAFYMLFRKKKTVLAGTLLFALSNLVLVLQLVPFGEVLTADRYMYLAMIGFGWALLWLLRNQEKFIKPVVFFVAILFSIFTFGRSKVWKNGLELYSDIISKYPQSAVALNSLGAEYLLRGELKKAHAYVDKAIAVSPQLHKAWYNGGLIYAREHNYLEALKNFDMAISLAAYPKAIISRAGIYYELKDYARAINDATDALRKEPDSFKAHFLLGNCFNDLNQLEKALYSYDRAIALKGDEPEFYFKRAIVKGKMQRFADCLADLEIATSLGPEFAEAFYWKGVARVNLKKNPCADFQKALNLGYEEARNPFYKYCK
ncbi:MAG: tetratricopeptide repeat protein, partial [Bacteroidia bacterium]